jgi:glycosyltransferase involved in cell wall biosynthesis
MKISVIICTRNHCLSLNQTLLKLDSVQIPAGLQVELIVVDNGSVDNTHSVACAAREHWPTDNYVFEQVAGLAAARNSGLAAASGEIIVFTDDDVRPDVGWLSELLPPIVNGRFDAVTGAIRLAPNLTRTWMLPFHRKMLASTEGIDSANLEELVGANMAFHRRVLQNIPAFDPELGAGRLGFCEESLFSYQLKQAGYSIDFSPNASIEHHFEASRLTRESFLARAAGQGRSDAYISHHWRHLQYPDAWRRLLRLKTRFWLERLIHRHELESSEGCAEWEMNRVENISGLDQFLKESLRPRAYELRGLRKLTSQPIPSATASDPQNQLPANPPVVPSSLSGRRIHGK